MAPPSRAAVPNLMRRSWPAAALAIALLAGPPLAPAAPLGITPTQINLAPGQNSDLIAITNDGDAEVRLQVEIFAWDQQPSGETILGPTQDILAFPPLLSIAAHETKRVRVGAAAPPGEAEKSYRLTIQELPPPPREGANPAVQVLTKVSLPIFLQPGSLKPDAAIEMGQTERGLLSFTVRDTGTQHFLLKDVVVTGMSAIGAKTFEAKAGGWYVLARGRRDYRLALSRADCQASPQIVVVAQLQDSEITARHALAPGSCGDGAKTQYITAGDAAQ